MCRHPSLAIQRSPCNGEVFKRRHVLHGAPIEGLWASSLAQPSSLTMTRKVWKSAGLHLNIVNRYRGSSIVECVVVGEELFPPSITNGWSSQSTFTSHTRWSKILTWLLMEKAIQEHQISLQCQTQDPTLWDCPAFKVAGHVTCYFHFRCSNSQNF